MDKSAILASLSRTAKERLLYAADFTLADQSKSDDIDLLLFNNTIAFRQYTASPLILSMLPIGDANYTVLREGKKLLTHIESSAPVIAGLCFTDPYHIMGNLFAQIKSMGCIGVQNFPSVGLFDNQFQRNLKNSDISFEEEMIRMRKASGYGLITAPFVFDFDQASISVKSGANLIFIHPCFRSEQEAIYFSFSLARKIKEQNKSIIVFGLTELLSGESETMLRSAGIDGTYSLEAPI